MTALVQTNHRLDIERAEYPLLERNPIRIIAWNTIDPNIMGMVRTAEAFMAERVYMLRQPKRQSEAAGAHHWQPVTYTLDLLGEVERARQDGYSIVALEQTTGSIPLTKARLPLGMCLLVGNEGNGLSPAALAMADMAIEIPQFGFVSSLNVVTATSIALYEWVRQHKGRLSES